MSTHQSNDTAGNVSHDGVIMTVSGPITPSAAGFTLPHEHLMSTFGAASARYPYYDMDKLLSSVLPYLGYVKELGCRTIVDCTAAYFGRHPELLRQLATESGLFVLTNTGYYAAADDRYVPPHAFRESAEQVATRWVREWTDGIDETGIQPGFIKTAIDDGSLSDIDRKLIRAAALAHAHTGLTIQTHTGDNWTAVQEILAILRAEQVDPSAWIWTHAHHVRDQEQLVQTATSGAWISFDGLSSETAPHILGLVIAMKKNGQLGRVLLSHDGDSYYGDGACRPYDFLFTDFIPMLKAQGFSPAEIDELTVYNPGRAFTVRERKTG
jgi:predicted metal-dependent phosphotriesterase family hydrolase